MMKNRFDNKVKELTKRAKESGKTRDTKIRVPVSSLGKVIRTKEQADLFMKLLKEA